MSEALGEGRSRDLAESVAWRIWEEAAKTERAQDTCKTLDDVAGRFGAWADTYYRRTDGQPTRETANCEIALRPLRVAHGRKAIDGICYQDIWDTREELVRAGLNRTTINQRVGIWKRFFSWALENRHCSPQTKSEVWAIASLKRHRSPAPEGSPTMPVKHRDVKAVLPFMSPTVRAMVSVQELCGARPGEVCQMRPCDIDQRRDVWVYRPQTHKTQHKDQVRVIAIGPRAQRAIMPYMDGPAEKPMFSPIIAMKEHGHMAPRDPAAERVPGESYSANNYGQAIRYAQKAARKAGVDVADWTANQLRHSCGTRVRRRFGPDAARAVLGHSAGSARITDRYTGTAIEQEFITAASRPMRVIG